MLLRLSSHSDQYEAAARLGRELGHNLPTQRSRSLSVSCAVAAYLPKRGAGCDGRRVPV